MSITVYRRPALPLILSCIAALAAQACASATEPAPSTDPEAGEEWDDPEAGDAGSAWDDDNAVDPHDAGASPDAGAPVDGDGGTGPDGDADAAVVDSGLTEVDGGSAADAGADADTCGGVGGICWGETHHGTRFGGSGYAATILACPEGSAVSGIEGGAGRYIDSVSVLCRSMALGDGGSIDLGADVAAAGGRVGGTRGGAYSLTCPAGKVAVGIFGAAGIYIDSLGIECATPYVARSGAVRTRDAERVGPAGGGGGGAFDYSCPSASVATAVKASSRRLLDRRVVNSVGINCRSAEAAP